MVNGVGSEEKRFVFDCFGEDDCESMRKGTIFRLPT
jgi:hypothetical protein